MAICKLLIGVPGSGKSTYSEQLKKEGYIIVSSDEIRKELFGDANIQNNGRQVFDIVYNRVFEALKNNQNVVLDATNVYQRQKTLNYIRNYINENIKHPVKIEGVIFDTSLLDALFRNSIRDRYVPESVIASMFLALEQNYPKLEEGFDEIKKYSEILEETKEDVLPNFTKEELINIIHTFENDTPDIVTNVKINNIEGYITYDDDDKYYSYSRIYYFPDTITSLSKRIVLDEKVERIINKDKLVDFIFKYIDANSLQALEKMVFIWDDKNIQENIRRDISNEYGDIYAFDLAFNTLGETWTDRQIIGINVSKILETSVDIYLNDILTNSDNNNNFEIFVDIFSRGLLSTICHENRHLLYECNELIQLGDKYSYEGGLEENVEEYGNNECDRLRLTTNWDSLINQEELNKLMSIYLFNDLFYNDKNKENDDIER